MKLSNIFSGLSGEARCVSIPCSTVASMVSSETVRLFLQIPLSIIREHRRNRPRLSPPAMTYPDPHWPHFNRPESKRRDLVVWYRAGPPRSPRRRCTAFHVSSLIMRSSGTSATIHSDDGFGRLMRRPFSGFLMKLCRFQTIRPTYSSFWRMPFRRFRLPPIVDAFQ
jgi:hypothetical protein